MAEGFFAQKLNNIDSSVTVTSAGIGALVDYPAESNAHAVMKQYGIDISKHRARQISEELVRKAEIILVMTQSHLSILVRQFLQAKGKTFLLGHWQDFEIHDPFKQPYETFERVYQQIELAWQDWKIRI